MKTIPYAQLSRERASFIGSKYVTIDTLSSICSSLPLLCGANRNKEFLEAMRNHIDFTTISQKVKAGSYTNLDQMTNDFEQMINDAKEFFPQDSQDHQVSKWKGWDE